MLLHPAQCFGLSAFHLGFSTQSLKRGHCFLNEVFLESARVPVDAQPLALGLRPKKSHPILPPDKNFLLPFLPPRLLGWWASWKFGGRSLALDLIPADVFYSLRL